MPQGRVARCCLPFKGMATEEMIVKNFLCQSAWLAQLFAMDLWRSGSLLAILTS